MDHLLFPFPPHLKLYWNHHHHGEDAHQSNHQKQSEQNIAAFTAMGERTIFGEPSH
jgi:hypothetical protein